MPVTSEDMEAGEWCYRRFTEANNPSWEDAALNTQRAWAQWSKDFRVRIIRYTSSVGQVLETAKYLGSFFGGLYWENMDDQLRTVWLGEARACVKRFS